MFAAELAKEMEKMLGQVGGGNTEAGTKAGPSAAIPAGNDEDEQFREMFEKLLKAGGGGSGENGSSDSGGEPDLEELTKLMNGLAGGGSSNGFPGAAGRDSNSSSSSKGKTAAAPTTSFQDSIKATMSKLAESEAQHKSRTGKSGSAAAGGGGGDDPLAALMAQMEAMGAGGEGGEDGDLPELLDGLMDQLMSKELLAEPIAELRVKVDRPV